MDNWKKVCEKVSTTMNLSEMKFEKGVATLILSNLGWNEFRGNIQEQFKIEDHAKGYFPDFALFPDDDDMPGLYVELKKTDHKQRTKDVKQIRTYMMLTDCRFCLYFGEKMELFFIKNEGRHRVLKSVLTLDYNPKNPDGNRLLDLITYDTFDEDKLLRFCEDRLAADEAIEFYTSEEGRKRLFELMAKDRQLSDGAKKLLPSMLTMPERKTKGVEDVTDEEDPLEKPSVTKPNIPINHGDIIGDFKAFAEKSVGVNTTRNYIRHLKDGVSQFFYKLVDKNADSIFCITNSSELKECIATLKGNSDFVAENKKIRYFYTASLSKYLEFLENKEGKVAPSPKLQPKKHKKEGKKLNERRKPRPSFQFSMIGLKVGDEVTFDPRDWRVRVASENTVDYNGEQLKMTTFCKKYLPDNMRNKSEAYQGPDYFSYAGKTLATIRDEKEDFRSSRKKKG